MRLLLIEPYSNNNQTRMLIPVGLPYLAAGLKNAGHEIIGLNPNRWDRSHDHGMAEILRYVREGDFDVVGMGGLCYSFAYQREVFRGIREENEKVVLVSGGNMFSSEPELCMQEYDVDFGIFGEGEISFPLLLQALEAGEDFLSIAGIYYRQDGQVRSTRLPGEVLRNLDELPFPEYELFYDAEDIAERRVQLSVYTSRSCPFHCTFCYHPKGNPYRRRSVGNVISEIKEVYERYGLDGYYFGDELFLYEKGWILSFCDELEKLPFLKGWSCQTRATYTDPELLKRIAQAGCTHVRVGFESGSDTILQSMRKKTTVKDNCEAIARIRKEKMVVDGGIIMGDFAETKETMAETIAFVKKTNLVPNQGVIFVTPLPGSEIYRRCINEGRIKDQAEYITSLDYPAKLRINMTQMSDAALLGLQESAARKIFSHLVTECRGEITAIGEVRESCSHLDVSCPFCRTTQEVQVGAFTLEVYRYCENCCQPIFLSPLDIPHFKRMTERFRSEIGKIEEDGSRDILVTPSCLDFIRLSVVANIPLSRVLAFLDKSSAKASNNYFSIQVLQRERGVVSRLEAKKLIIVSADFCQGIYEEVTSWGIEDLQVIPILDQQGADVGGEPH